MKTKFFLMAGVALMAMSGSAMALPAVTNGVGVGPSTAANPYILPSDSRVTMYSLLTTGDVTPNGNGGTYTLDGTPDGLGAYDNHDGTFTVLMNHEFQANEGAVRDHGAIGSFVSKYTISKSTLAVLSGSDLIQTVVTADGVVHNAANGNGVAFGRFCSADLPVQSALYNAATGNGTQEKIFFNGEENGNNGRAFANVVTGANAGTSYELPYLGKMSWENGVANGATGDKTVIIGTDDTSPNGQVYVYVGTKTNSGSDIEKAGLTNGSLFAIKVNGLGQNEQPNSSWSGPQTFSLVALGDVSGKTGDQLQADTVAAGGTGFLRPEDSAWDPTNPNVLYFQTTNAYDGTINGDSAATGRSRLWEATFIDSKNPTLGGTLKAVIDGGVGGQRVNMLDNLTVDQDGKVVSVEDIGNAKPAGKVWGYDPVTGKLTELARFDKSLFGDCVVGGTAADCTPATSPFTIDEEASGILDISYLFDDSGSFRYYLLDAQAHYRIPGEEVEGGQLLLMRVALVPEPATLSLFGFGMAGVYAARRRQKNQK